MSLLWRECPLHMVSDKDRKGALKEEGRTIRAYPRSGEWLGLKGIVCMEAFDISQLSAWFESVGLMVVHEKGRLKKRLS